MWPWIELEEASVNRIWKQYQWHPWPSAASEDFEVCLFHGYTPIVSPDANSRVMDK